MKHYKNIYINVRYEDQIEDALRARGQECASLTEAKNKARAYGGYAVRVYLDDGGSIAYYRVFINAY